GRLDVLVVVDVVLLRDQRHGLRVDRPGHQVHGDVRVDLGRDDRVDVGVRGVDVDDGRRNAVRVGPAALALYQKVEGEHAALVFREVQHRLPAKEREVDLAADQQVDCVGVGGRERNDV